MFISELTQEENKFELYQIKEENKVEIELPLK